MLDSKERNFLIVYPKYFLDDGQNVMATTEMWAIGNIKKMIVA